MAISDPALEFIESQKPRLLDFIFRLTGDRSRAGIIANEVCEFVHRELMSSWSQQDIRVELFAYAYEANRDAIRGIEKSFFETYYRNQFNDTKKVTVYYPLEIFLLELGLPAGLVAALEHRYKFVEEEIARIMDRTLEEVQADKVLIQKQLKRHPKLKLEEAINLPIYDFLNLPDHHPTAISHILVDMKPKRIEWQPKIIGLLVLLGLIVGFVIYSTIRLLAP